MKKFGCITALAGLLVFIISLVLFGTAIFRAIDSNRVTAIPLIVGKTTTTDLINVDTDKLVEIGFDFTPSHRTTRYRFPYLYTVYDGNGKEIFNAEGEMSGIRPPSEPEHPMSGTHYRFQFGTKVFSSTNQFEVVPPGQIRIEVLVKQDTEYRAKLDSAELVVWDNVSAQTGTVLSGIGFLLLGPPIIFVGLAVFVIGAVKEFNKSE